MTDMETPAFEREVSYVLFPRGGTIPNHAGPHGKLQGRSGGRRSKEGVWARAFIMFFSWGKDG